MGIVSVLLCKCYSSLSFLPLLLRSVKTPERPKLATFSLSFSLFSSSLFFPPLLAVFVCFRLYGSFLSEDEKRSARKLQDLFVVFSLELSSSSGRLSCFSAVSKIYSSISSDTPCLSSLSFFLSLFRTSSFSSSKSIDSRARRTPIRQPKKEREKE